MRERERERERVEGEGEKAFMYLSVFPLCSSAKAVDWSESRVHASIG